MSSVPQIVWAIQRERCWNCGHEYEVRVPVEYPVMKPPPRPEAEHRAAQAANERMHQQSSARENERC